VSTPNVSTQLQQATLTLDSFEKSTQPGVWPNLDKKTIIADMRSRLADPFQVNQGGQPFCGPASILFELVRKQPLRSTSKSVDVYLKQVAFKVKPGASKHLQPITHYQ
jgi:hypothetical protein